MSRTIKIFLVVLSGLVLIDLFFLNYQVILEKKKTSPLSPSGTNISPSILPSPTIGSLALADSDVCPAACLAEIDKKIPTEKKTSPTPETKKTTSTVKEFYVPFGSGSTKNMNWEEISGVEAVIDSANFSGVKSIIFEASLRIPSANGRVYAKLYDVTSKHDVWFSEVSAEGPSSYRAESAKVSLSPGQNLYRVMLKSTMGYEAILDWARLKIILE
jgi:hypothetical protein